MTDGSALESRIEIFLAELARWAPRSSLVGSTDPSELRVHVDDALAAAAHLDESARVVDLGSGAGFPGVPLALARPDLHLVLVEIREKRVHFLRHVVRKLALGCEVRRVRIEDAPAEPFDVALLRAVAEPDRALAMALPWVRAEGEVWIWAGPRAAPATPAQERIPIPPRGDILRFSAAQVSRGTL